MWRRIQAENEATERREKDQREQSAAGDYVLVKQQRKNKCSTPYAPVFYVECNIRGSQVTARRVTDGRTVCGDASQFKVTVHLQECLAWKRGSASGLNCRYLNPYVKLTLIGLAIRLHQNFWKEMNCRIFHDSKMQAPESPFERDMLKRILFFAYLVCSSVSEAKALKKLVCDLSYSISVKNCRTFLK